MLNANVETRLFLPDAAKTPNANVKASKSVIEW